MAVFREHTHAYPDVPLAMRDQLALAAENEKHQRYHEAADRYRDAIASWPDDPLAPRALMGYARLSLQMFMQPEEALELLERARAHPHATPEFQKASTEMMAAAQDALRPASEGSKASPQVSPTSPAVAGPPPVLPPEAPVQEEPVGRLPARPLAPILMRAVGIDARGLHLQDRRGGTSRLAWPQVTAISVASIGKPAAADPVADCLILDLWMGPRSTPVEGGARRIRLSIQDLAIPQLESEPSPLRAFQRLVATILKATGATAYPSREACVGLDGFPSFPNAAAYEADLMARLAPPGSPDVREGDG
jgi:hypothetical protein